MDKWILNPNELDFDAGLASPVNTGAGTPYKVENAVYKNGDLLFYVNNGSVYDASGNNAGQFADGSAMLKEVAIAPQPGGCNAYCLFWLETRPLVTLSFFFQEVLVDQFGNVTLGNKASMDEPGFVGNTGGIAVSPVIAGTEADRYVYVVAPGGIQQFSLSEQGFSYVTTNPVSVINNFICEADLSNDGSMLTWANGNTVFAGPPLGQSPFSISIGGAFDQVFGVEFDVTDDYVYISHGVLGLLRWKPGAPKYEVVGENPFYNNTQLELAKDGYIYAVRNDGKLGRIKNLTVSSYPGDITVFSDNPAPTSGSYYALPDQVDGEPYSLFLGVRDLVLEIFDINGEEVFDTIDSTHPPLQTYNCAPINLNTQISGTPALAILHVYSTDPSNGNQVTGPNFLNYQKIWNTAPPSTIDLRCVESTACDLFTAFINPPFNTFAANLMVFNSCGTATSQTGQFKVDDAPDPAQVGLAVNNTITGIPCPASHDIQNPCPAGIFSASINLSNSNGDIDYYQLTLDEVDCNDGSFISSIYSGSQVPVNDVSELTALALNALIIGGQTGFFADPAWIGRCLRITATVGNVCGFSTDFTYLQFDGSYLGNPNDDGVQYKDKPSSFLNLASEKMTVFPNPFDGAITLVFTLPEDVALTLSVVDVSGKTFSRPYSQTYLGKGEHKLVLDGTKLPPGVYTLRLETSAGVIARKIVKFR